MDAERLVSEALVIRPTAEAPRLFWRYPASVKSGATTSHPACVGSFGMLMTASGWRSCQVQLSPDSV